MATIVVAHSHGEVGDLASESLQAELGECRVGLDQAIGVGHLGPVLAALVPRYRGEADPRLQGFCGVGKRRRRGPRKVNQCCENSPSS